MVVDRKQLGIAFALGGALTALAAFLMCASGPEVGRNVTAAVAMDRIQQKLYIPSCSKSVNFMSTIRSTEVEIELSSLCLNEFATRNGIRLERINPEDGVLVIPTEVSFYAEPTIVRRGYTLEAKTSSRETRGVFDETRQIMVLRLFTD